MASRIIRPKSFYMRYRYIPDCPRDFEVIGCVPVEPNDSAVSDADILRGRVARAFKGQYYKDSSESLNPLHRRGVDFTDVGNILASIDSQEERVNQNIAKRRKEMAAGAQSNGSSGQD